MSSARGAKDMGRHYCTSLNHEEVDQVIFSQDSSMFASLSGRDTKFWDTVTGAPIGTIVDKVSAIAKDFSSTAASYNDSTITLYDVNSCTSLAMLNVAPASGVDHNTPFLPVGVKTLRASQLEYAR